MAPSTPQPSSAGTSWPAPSPSVLDIFVVWHPEDKEGSIICDILFEHYHSDAFAGLAGSAVEVYGRSRPAPGHNELPIPIITADGTIGKVKQGSSVRTPRFAVILPFIDEHLVRSSIDDSSEWRNYLTDIVDLQSQHNRQTLVLPILPRALPEYSNSPVITMLMKKQGVQQGNIGSLDIPDKRRSCAAQGELTRDLSQSIIQNLLQDPEKKERLRIFISHSRYDIPDTDNNDIEPTGVVSKVESWIKKTKLADFVDIHDIQPGDDWDKEIRRQAQGGALLMVRTDHYSSREWTQWEVLEAKKAEIPIVCLSALTKGEQRGSFLLDHVPTVAYPNSTGQSSKKKRKDSQGKAIIAALNRLVDESLRQSLWRHQEIPQHVSQTQNDESGIPESESTDTSLNDNHGFDAVPAHAPEPLMLTRFLSEHRSKFPKDTHLWLIHPDPPLLPPEHEVMVELCTLASYERSQVHLLTPRTFFAAGGTYGQGEPQLSTSNLALNRPLSEYTLGMSMSQNEDIEALGLRTKHLELVVAEVAQMMLLSGGRITYAGAIGTHIPDLTGSVLKVIKKYIEEVKLEQHRLGRDNDDDTQSPIHSGYMFELTVPCTSISNEKTRRKLISTARSFTSTGIIRFFDENGDIRSIQEAKPWKNRSRQQTSAALHNIRKELPHYCDARLVIGGKTVPASIDPRNGYLGDYPGIIEEALYTVRNKQPLFIAGGFGGAAALLAHSLEISDDVPISTESIAAIEGNRDYKNAITEIKDLYNNQLIGLDDDDLKRLTTTQRASELAGLIIKGIATKRNSN
ncbi:hypothetical protein [Actinomyces viscosus]|uniref:hypothetical protein n=1 Tax=Actinomyces viscosus TaxID=1656 RepID=UPI0028F125DF|nr:hypothetical protein [Actinomyces viscosus]